MLKLTGKLFEKYLAAPLQTDDAVREMLKLPDNKYYSVVTWSTNQDAVGNVYVVNITREVKTKKISKSDQSKT